MVASALIPLYGKLTVCLGHFTFILILMSLKAHRRQQAPDAFRNFNLFGRLRPLWCSTVIHLASARSCPARRWIQWYRNSKSLDRHLEAISRMAFSYPKSSSQILVCTSHSQAFKTLTCFQLLWNNEPYMLLRFQLSGVRFCPSFPACLETLTP